VHARTWAGGPGEQRAPVVLVHGLGLSSRYLVPLGRRLAALGHRVLAPDLPGFGRSPKPRGAVWPAGPDVREQTEQLRAWLDACGVERAVLFGNSVGVQVAVEFAVRFPARVERLVLEGPTPDPRYRTPLRQYPRVLLNMVFEAPSVNPLFQVEYLSTGVARMAQQLVRTVDDPIELRLPDVPVPTLVVRGRYDQTLSQPWAEEFTRLLPNGRLVVVEGAAHNAHYSAPELMARLTDVFLRGDLDAIRSGADRSADVLADDDRGPLARRRLSPLVHAAMDYASAVLLIAVPRALHWGPRTRELLTMFGVLGLADSMMTDYPGGLVQKIPLPVHLNLEASGGLQLLVASLTILRGEPATGRWAVAAQGLMEVFRSSLTRLAAGPARLVTIPPTSE
jgi:pimeloyl-ACP methyl ester carboxylesterase